MRYFRLAPPVFSPPPPRGCRGSAVVRIMGHPRDKVQVQTGRERRSLARPEEEEGES